MIANNDASSTSVPIGAESTSAKDASEERESVQHSSKYFPYFLSVDPEQEDRANEIKLCSVQRPHMRAFHFAWWCYHVAFLMW